MHNFFYSLISFIVSLFFILFGIICMMFPWDADIRTAAIQFVLENSLAIVLFGFGMFLIGASVIVNLFQNVRKRYYHVRTDANAISVDENIIQSYLNSYWKNHYPNEEIPYRFTINKNKIHLYADLPYCPKPQQQTEVERIQSELSALLRRSVGLKTDFKLSLSFEREKSRKEVVQN